VYVQPMQELLTKFFDNLQMVRYQKSLFSKTPFNVAIEGIIY
jgi:hypothetical protein